MKREQGRLLEWHDDKGYGFIESLQEPKQRIFLHIKSFEKAGPRPIVGCVLEYTVNIDSQSRLQASKVRYVKASEVGKTARTANPNQQTDFSSRKPIALTAVHFAIIAYWVCVVVLAIYQLLPPFTILALSLINTYSYWLYSKDKQHALHGDWRVPEQRLLLCAVLGGWTASVLAQQHFHHKTQKQPFQRYFQIASVAHCLLLLASVAVYDLLK